MDYLEKYKMWCEDENFDDLTKSELESIRNNEDEIKDRFYKELEFGTAGLRGVMGTGTNRMNIYTVGKATQGLANVIKNEKAEDRGVVIAFDSRKMSKEFSENVALILNANGIKTYIFDSLRPVPELSFAVRFLNCIAGIMITASHNPAEYNGYKVYWEDGAQITAPKDKIIIDEVKKINNYSEIKRISMEECKSTGLYNIIGKEIDEKYLNEIEKLVLNKQIIKKVQKDLKIVYTPLHGTGTNLVKEILNKLGFENVYIVKEQEKPDGNFPTVRYPNPEDKEAFNLALKLAKEIDADIVLATDPDADRLGIYSKDLKTGEYISFTGNMSATLIAEYEFSQKKEKGLLHKNGALIKSIVSSKLADDIAKEYNLSLIEVLTGFKYIGEQIKVFEKNNEYTYEFGFEESYGCLIGTHARDKDAICAVMILCEAAAYYKEKGLTLWDQMINIYNKYGFYKEDLISIKMEGIDGKQKIDNILYNLRNNKLSKIGKYNVLEIKDYKEGIVLNMKTQEIKNTNLPTSNVIYYELENKAWCAIRPSGTEPKIKIYMGIKSDSLEHSEKEIKYLKNAIIEIIK